MELEHSLLKLEQLNFVPISLLVVNLAMQVEL